MSGGVPLDGRAISSLFDAAGVIWFPYIHRSLASAAEECAMCTVAGKNLKTICRNNDLGTNYEPRDPSECIQVGFWGPIKYLSKSDKYVLVAVDRFSRWPSAMQ